MKMLVLAGLIGFSASSFADMSYKECLASFGETEERAYQGRVTEQVPLADGKILPLGQADMVQIIGVSCHSGNEYIFITLMPLGQSSLGPAVKSKSPIVEEVRRIYRLVPKQWEALKTFNKISRGFISYS